MLFIIYCLYIHIIFTLVICIAICVLTMNVGPCHHGMVRPRVADGGTASNMEGNCE